MPLTLEIAKILEETNRFGADKSIIGLKAAIAILGKWGASSKQMCAILCITPSIHASAQKQTQNEWTINFDEDVIQRISLVLNIHSLLRQIFDNPKNVYGFASMKNDNGFFNGRAPLDVMVQGDLASLYETLKHVEALHAISQ